jgi:hypothetical protein
MSRRNDNDYGGPYTSGPNALGYRSYRQSRYENNNDHDGWRDQRYDDMRDEAYYDYRDMRYRDGAGPAWDDRDRFYGRDNRRNEMNDRSYYDSRDRDERNDERYHRWESRYEDPRNPRTGPGERYGESHQHYYHARSSDSWDRPAAYNGGGYGEHDRDREFDRNYNRDRDHYRSREDDYWNVRDWNSDYYRGRRRENRRDR